MSEDSSGFDVSAGANWIYPSNLPVRDYQYNIVQHALFKNTLVCLPTGLGKTFVAAVVMYNFYRWYPKGKIVFMTPTRPLVAQQIDACFNVMGIPQGDMTEMTGTQQPASRAEQWRTKRIFFLTPQVFMNDLGRGVCDGTTIRCLVIDEAHKAQKNHAYCQVVRDLCRVNSQFRVLALSATPGNDIKDVQQVINNILISHVEIRSEESIDVQPYTHHKQVEKVVVSIDGNLSSIVDKYLVVCSGYVNRLQENRVLYHQAPSNVTKFMLLKAREKFRADPPQLPPAFIGRTEADFAIAMSLYHGLELVQLHGPRSLYNHLQGVFHGDKASPRVRAELMKNAALMELFEELGVQFDPNRILPGDPDAPHVSADLHPKMRAVDEIVLKHFMDCQNGVDGKPLQSCVIVFAQYRDTVDEIKRLLERHRPLIKPVVFIGHGGASSSATGTTAASGGAKKGRGRGKAEPVDQDEAVEAVPVPGRVAAAKMSQKDQLEIMERFRRGDYNTLVATSIVEEGLDIGEVDLIVCFDAHRSPIRLVQRMGRTGRKRNGRCVMLVTAGKEDVTYEQGVKKRKALNKSIENARNTLQFFNQNPRMVPDDLKPQPLLIEVTRPEKIAVPTTTIGRGRGRGRTSTAGSKKSKPGTSARLDQDALPSILEDAKSDDSNSAKAPMTAADYVEALAQDLYSQPTDQNKKCDVIVVNDKPSTSTRRKRTKLERSDSTAEMVASSKQRKVYEFFAAPAAKPDPDFKTTDDDVVFVDNVVANQPNSEFSVRPLKQRLANIIATALPSDAVLTFNTLVCSAEPFVPFPEGKAGNEFAHVSSFFASPVSWSDFNLEAFVTEVSSHLDDLDFPRMTHYSTIFMSPVGKPSQLVRPMSAHLTASTPKNFFEPPAPVGSTSKANSTSTSSMLDISQALDILSVATPKPHFASIVATPANPLHTVTATPMNPIATIQATPLNPPVHTSAPPTTASKSVAPASAVRNRYISPVIESLAAAFRRKQMAQQSTTGSSRTNGEISAPAAKQSTINFDIDFDLDFSCSGNKSFKEEPTTETMQVDVSNVEVNFAVNFDLEFDFAPETSAEPPEMPMSSFAFNKENALETVEEKSEINDDVEEMLDDDLLAALTCSPEIAPSPEPAVPSPIVPLDNYEHFDFEDPQPVSAAVSQRPVSAIEDSPILRKAKPAAGGSKFGKYKSFPQPSRFESTYIDDDDDFKSPTASRRAYEDKPSTSKQWMSTSKASSSLVEQSPSPIVVAKRKGATNIKKTKRKPLGRQFLETQAGQSDSEESLGTEGSDEDRDLSGFVDHDHYSPQDSQDHAMYLQMQINDNRTPQFANGRFKLAYNRNNNASAIYSQTPGSRRSGDDTYVEDSFCVGDDFVEFEESSVVDLTPSQPKRSRRARKRSPKAEPRRRMVIISEDEDENEDDENAEVAAAISACFLPDSPPPVQVVKPQPAAMMALQNSPRRNLHQPRAANSSSYLPPGSPVASEVFRPPMPESPCILSQTAKRVQQASASAAAAATTVQKPPEVVGKIALIISPRELQSAQAVVAELRNTYSTAVFCIIRSSSAASIAGLDYVISCRCAATRVKLSTLVPPTGNAQTRKKAIDEIASLAAIVDEPVVIIEEDVAERNPTENRPHNTNEPSKLYATSQVVRLFAQAASRRIRVLFSADVTSTASLVVDLANEEAAAGSAVRITDSVSTELMFGASPAAANGLTARMRFFEAAGQAVTPMIALRLALSFPVLKAFFDSNVDLSPFAMSTCARQALTRLRTGRCSSAASSSSNNNNSVNTANNSISVNQAAAPNNNNDKVSSKQSSAVVRRS